MTQCQRWLHGRDRYRPAGEVLDPSRYGVEEIDEATAKACVETHHYAGSYPAARLRVGMFEGPELVGVAVLSVPASNAVFPKWLGVPGVELGRLVLLDRVPGNGESWFLRRVFETIRAELRDVQAVLSFSDPMARTTIDGEQVKPGHYGVIYQAFGGRYLGRANPNTILLDPRGLVVSNRLRSKLTTDSRGRDYAERALLEAGAPVRQRFEDGKAWWKRCLREAPWRRVRHPGNHAYAWALSNGVQLRSQSVDVVRPCTWCGEPDHREAA